MFCFVNVDVLTQDLQQNLIEVSVVVNCVFCFRKMPRKARAEHSSGKAGVNHAFKKQKKKPNVVEKIVRSTRKTNEANKRKVLEDLTKKEIKSVVEEIKEEEEDVENQIRSEGVQYL